MDTIHTSSSSSNSNVDDIDYNLEPSLWSLERLKQAATELRLQRPRSLAWAILLQVLPPPNADIISSIKTNRNFYNDLKKKLNMDPRGAVGDDPLSQNDESVWRQHFCDMELKSLILQDVVRTFPDELYFREQEVQDLMVRVLFFWSRSHALVGYRQGMHEILAPLLYELFLDREFAPSGISENLKYILSPEHLEHDSYMLFSAVIRALEKFYITGDMIVPSSNGRKMSKFSRSLVVLQGLLVKVVVMLGLRPRISITLTSQVLQFGLRPHCSTCSVVLFIPKKMYGNPNEVLRYLERVKEDVLRPLDPELASHLSSSNISMELFGIRWLRLLFGREFPRSELAALWGFAFSGGPTLPDLHLLVVAILLAGRKQLLHPDPGVVLAGLMRPCGAGAAHVCALARHLRSPRDHARPPDPTHADTSSSSGPPSPSMEQMGSEAGAFDSGSEGVAEGADVARELAALAVLRARLPPAAAALAAALPAPPPRARDPLRTIMQLSALLQCRNHALIDVETALEAAEGDTSERVGRRQLVAVNIKRNPPSGLKPANKVKEVPLKLFHQVECTNSELPSLDPLRLRTD